MTAVLKHLKAKVLDGGVIAITLEMTNPAWMTGNLIFVGASMQASAAPGDYCSSFTLHPKKNEDGIFAVSIEESHKVTDKKVSFVTVHRDAYFLQVQWKDGKPFAHIDTPYFPTKGIGHLHGAGGGVPYIEVTLPNGMRLCSYEGRKSPFVDGNLLCRYLAGIAKLNEVLHGVVQSRLIPTREQIIHDLSREVQQLGHKNSELRNENNHWCEKNAQLKNNLARAQITLSQMVHTLGESHGKWVAWGRQVSPILKAIAESRLLRLFLGGVTIPHVDTPQPEELIISANEWLLSKSDCAPKGMHL